MARGKREGRKERGGKAREKERLIGFSIFLKEPAPGFVDSLYSSFCFYLIDFSPEFDYFLHSTPCGCICFVVVVLELSVVLLSC